MALKAAKCSECGASLKVDESREFGYCTRCGTKYITEKIISNTITNVEQQVNLYFGENVFEKEKKQCEVLIKCLKERDFHVCKSLSLKILEQNPENQLANMVYKCNFKMVEEADFGYKSFIFKLDPVTNYFKLNKGLISVEFSELMIDLIKLSSPITLGLENCIKSIFENIESLVDEKDKIVGFFISAKDFYLLDSAIEDLEKQLKESRGIGLKALIFTDNEYLAAEMGELRSDLKKLTKSLKSYREELFELISELYNSTKKLTQEDRERIRKREEQLKEILGESNKQGCYIATCVYGSYDCPEVWTLRRYRDYKLAQSCLGRLFIKIYYAISPTIIKWFGDKKWFRKFWKNKLDKKISRLRKQGYEDTRYEDKKWN